MIPSRVGVHAERDREVLRQGMSSHGTLSHENVGNVLRTMTHHAASPTSPENTVPDVVMFDPPGLSHRGSRRQRFGRIFATNSRLDSRDTAPRKIDSRASRGYGWFPGIRNHHMRTMLDMVVGVKTSQQLASWRSN